MYATVERANWMQRRTSQSERYLEHHKRMMEIGDRCDQDGIRKIVVIRGEIIICSDRQEKHARVCCKLLQSAEETCSRPLRECLISPTLMILRRRSSARTALQDSLLLQCWSRRREIQTASSPWRSNLASPKSALQASPALLCGPKMKTRYRSLFSAERDKHTWRTSGIFHLVSTCAANAHNNPGDDHQSIITMITAVISLKEMDA